MYLKSYLDLQTETVMDSLAREGGIDFCVAKVQVFIQIQGTRRTCEYRINQSRSHSVIIKNKMNVLYFSLVSLCTNSGKMARNAQSQQHLG